MSAASPEALKTVTLTPRVRSALLRYRILAYTTGVLLIFLTIAVILKYTAGDHGATAVIGVAHGWIYVVYLLLSLDLAVKARFRPLSTVLVLLAGTIPLMSFVAEHYVTLRVRAGERL